MAVAAPPSMMPFGYSFDQSTDPPLPSPPLPGPAPQPERPLLNADESSRLNHFFDHFGTGYDPSLGDFGETENTNDDPDLFLDLPNYFPPPMLYGYSSDLPPRHIPSSSAPSASTISRSGVFPSDVELDRGPSLPTADVIQAASTLVQNGHTHSVNSTPNGTEHTSFEAGFFEQTYSPFGASSEQAYPSRIPNPLPAQHSPFAAEWAYQGQNGSNVNRTNIHVQFGSDNHFRPNGYAPPPTNETLQEVTEGIVGSMDCLEPQEDLKRERGSKTPLSSIKDSEKRNLSRRKSRGADNDQPPSEIGQMKRPHKRQKSGLESVPEMKKLTESAFNFKTTQVAGTPLPPGQNHRARKLSQSQSGSSDKKRKSALPYIRENLTDEQKRNNHILSEQKRRDMIKSGFRDLCELVPDVAEGLFSKSVILTEGARFLEGLKNDNDVLEAALRRI